MDSLKDLIQFTPTQIIEEGNGIGKRLRVRGLFQICDKKNANNRVYPQNVWEKVLSPDSQFMRRLKERKILGELEHPESGTTHLGRVSHLITDVHREVKNIYGEAIILKTPSGAILEELFKVGVPVGISSRGSGSTKNEDSSEIVQEDYDLRTFDFVYDPSVEEAYPELVNEARERVLMNRGQESTKEESSMPVDVKELLVRCGKAEESARSLLQSDKLPEVMEMNFSLEKLLGELSETKVEEFKAELNIYHTKLTGMKQMIADRMKILGKPVAEDTSIGSPPDPKKVIGPEGGDKTKLPKDQDTLSPEKDPKNSDLVTKTGKMAKESKVVKEGTGGGLGRIDVTFKDSNAVPGALRDKFTGGSPGKYGDETEYDEAKAALDEVFEYGEYVTVSVDMDAKRILGARGKMAKESRVVNEDPDPYGDVEKVCPECSGDEYEGVRAEDGNISGKCKKCTYTGEVADFVPENKLSPKDLEKRLRTQLESASKQLKVSIELGEALTDIGASLTSRCKTERRLRIVSERKLVSATKLLEATISRYKSEKLERYIVSEIEKDPSLKAVESVIRKKSTNVNEAKELITSLKGKVASKVEGEKEPLPPVGGAKEGGKDNLTEKGKAPAQVGSGQKLLDSIVSKTTR